MITFLAFLYLLTGLAYFYTHKSGYSLLRFMLIIQEDSPEAIGRAIADWYHTL